MEKGDTGAKGSREAHTKNCLLHLQLDLMVAQLHVRIIHLWVKGVGKIVLTAANGGAFTLSDVLWVPEIKKNLLSMSAIARGGLMVKFWDDRFSVHDHIEVLKFTPKKQACTQQRDHITMLEITQKR